jgi:hypothetical protein
MHNRAAGPRTLKDATLASYSTADNTSWTTPPPNQHRLLCFSFPPPLAAHLLLLRPPSHSKHDATARYRVGPLIHLAALNTRISPSINLSSRRRSTGFPSSERSRLRPLSSPCDPIIVVIALTRRHRQYGVWTVDIVVGMVQGAHARGQDQVVET